MHWNNGAIIKSHWALSVLSLARWFGPENVYVSVIESGSWDDSKEALRDMDLKLGHLGVERTILLEERTHEDEIARLHKDDEEGWIYTPRSPEKKELRRIPYLAAIRNRVMEPLDTLATRKKDPRTFTHVLWLNDVIFTVEDIIALLGTNNGSFAAACSMDFSHPPAFYDTFALRDADGEKPITQTWPYFLSSVSRNAMMKGRDVPVKSCWNGVVAFKASAFYGSKTHGQNPLKFRGIPDSLALQHLEGSESCLIHADNPLSREQGVFVNPNVRVAYNPSASEEIHPGAGTKPWPGEGTRFWGIWGNRAARVWGWGRRWSEGWVVKSRLKTWVEEGVRGEREEVGRECLVNEMQVLIRNGWAHV